MSAKTPWPLEWEALTIPLSNERGAQRASRGRPLFMLALVLGGWTTMRLATWESPFPDMLDVTQSPVLAQSNSQHSAPSEAPSQHVVFEENVGALAAKPAGATPQRPSASAEQNTASNVQAPEIAPLPYSEPADLQTGVSHQLMWLAALAYMPVPKSVQDAFEKSQSGSSSDEQERVARTPLLLPLRKKHNRWSLDAWTFWRQGSASPLVALGRSPSYGASQAGAVLRYQLDPASPYRPDAYIRAYSSLEGRTEQELAAGVSARPHSNLPLRFHTEARALQNGGRTRARMAGFVTTEIAPIDLPFGTRGEFYAQAGYVSGAQSTAFADGQLHIMREVTGFDLAAANSTKIKVGGAAFVGAQDEANRVDIGPTMRLEMTIGETPARLSVDWRERVAGDAEPDSGLAVTLSTRF